MLCAPKLTTLPALFITVPCEIHTKLSIPCRHKSQLPKLSAFLSSAFRSCSNPTLYWRRTQSVHKGSLSYLPKAGCPFLTLATCLLSNNGLNSYFNQKQGLLLIKRKAVNTCSQHGFNLDHTSLFPLRRCTDQVRQDLTLDSERQRLSGRRVLLVSTISSPQVQWHWKFTSY